MLSFSQCLEYVRSIDPSVKEEVAYALAGALCGLTLHQVALYFIKKNAKKPECRKPQNMNRRLNRFIKVVLGLRAGELSLTLVGSTFLFLQQAMKQALQDAAASAIGGMVLFLGRYLIKNPHIVYGDTIASVYSRALMPIDGGILVAVALSQIICNSSEAYLMKVLQSSETSDELKKRSIQRLFERFNLKNYTAQLSFVACIWSIIFFLWKNGLLNSLFILLEQLYEAYRSGKISKAVYRALIRRLMKQKIPIDPSMLPD